MTAQAYTIAWMALRFLREHAHGLRYVMIERGPGLLDKMGWQVISGMTWTIDYPRVHRMLVRTVGRVLDDTEFLPAHECVKARRRMIKFHRIGTRQNVLRVAAKMIADPCIVAPFTRPQTTRTCET